MSNVDARSFVLLHRFLLDLYATSDLAQLRLKIPSGLARLISCDRASFNDFDPSENHRIVVPTPEPVWWRRLGDVYCAHMMDHPVVNPEFRPALNQIVSLTDPAHSRRWRKTILCNEYFVPLGVNYQLGALIHQDGTRFEAIAVNRSKRDFDERDRAVFELLNRHCAQAWRNGLRVAELLCRSERKIRAAGNALGIVVLDATTGRLRMLTPESEEMLVRYYGTDSRDRGLLPAPVHNWLMTQVSGLLRGGVGALLPKRPLVKSGRNGQLTISLVQTTRTEVMVLIRERNCSVPSPMRHFAPLTRRENEVLSWMAEGKRNSEISIILGTSSRTVEKHVEHIFDKLKVETRTAAIREYLERKEVDDG